MKKTLLILFIILNVNVLMAQNVVWGEYGSRTEQRDDAGLRGDAGAISGFFQTPNPVNYPAGATGWWHLLDIRHTNPANNFSMQFSGNFYDQDLYFRKTINDPGAAWSRVLLERSGLTEASTIKSSLLTFKGEGANSNQANNHYGIYQESGDWNFPFPDLVINYHTGIKLVGYHSYGGIRFFGGYSPDGTPTTEVFSVANGDYNVRVKNQLFVADKIGIGTENTGAEKLSVNGKIRAKEIKVETANWPDYVFEPDYKSPSLKELEQFINANKHLPEIPSAKEVEENGVNLGEMNAKLLKKIEELTLYMINQDKRITKQEEIIKTLLKNE